MLAFCKENPQEGCRSSGNPAEFFSLNNPFHGGGMVNPGTIIPGDADRCFLNAKSHYSCSIIQNPVLSQKVMLFPFSHASCHTEGSLQRAD